MKEHRQKSRQSKGFRFSQIPLLAILLFAAAGGWYGLDRSQTPAPEDPDSLPLTAETSAEDASPAGYAIPSYPTTPDQADRTQRSGAAEFARNHVRSARLSSKGRLTSSAARQSTDRAIEHEDDMAMPEWARIISPDGSAIDAVNRRAHYSSNGIPDYVDLYAAFEAGYVEEVISDGVATDMSALLIARDVSDEVLYNGAVSAAHDLGNLYYMLTASDRGNLRFYFGVERLRSDLPTFVEFELNQVQVRVGSGVPWWNIQGSRRNGDLLVRFNMISGNLTSVELATWYQGGFHVFETDTDGLGSGCSEHFTYIYCIGDPPIDRPKDSIEVWDENYLPLEPVLADSFIELGLDMSRLMGSGAEFSSIYVRTPEDVLFTPFAAIGSPGGFGVGGP